ncbi:MAG: SEC-C metal-binding domain-containing protein [Clostridium sp.]|nr:SEC-C metal-binding domain-containing protein [Clostridium sp.]
MSNNENKMTEKVIEMDKANKNREVHMCSKCDKEAMYYNSDTKSWLCEDCKKVEDEFEKEAIKFEKKLSKRVYSFDLGELVECLSKDEIYNIARNLGVSKISGLNKDKLIEKLKEEYETLIEKRVNLFDEERYAILKSYLSKNGEKTFDDIDEEEAEKSAYFIQQGMLFPVLKGERSIFLMPEIVQNVLSRKNDIDYRRVIKSNSEIINTYRGMNNAYGILDVKEAVELLKKYFNDIDSSEIGSMLREASYYYNEYREQSGFFINNEIDNYEEILKDVEREKVEEYVHISKEELLSMSESNWVYNSKAGKAFYKEFTSMFSVDKDMTVAMMEDLVLDVQENEPKEAVDKMIELIKIENEDVRFVAAGMMNKFANKIRLWRFKGASQNDKKANDTTVKSEKVVGRNDPCPCGSGKKYKKCCGKNGNVVQLAK